MAEEYVRPPIEYKTECLIENTKRVTRSRRKYTRSSEEKELADQLLELDIQNIMIQSQIDYVNELAKQEQLKKEEYERENIKRIEKITRIKPILLQFKRISNYDNDIKGLIELLEPCLDSYCDGQINEYYYDKITYNNIMKHIKSVRLKPEQYELLCSIIKLET